MSTRGVMGFRADGKDYLTYNHSDSSPSCLGVEMAAFARSIAKAVETAKQQVSQLMLVTEEVKPTAVQIEKLSKDGKVNLNVSTQQETDWYCLLRGTQGDPQAILECGIMLDNHDFVRDSLFCEWGYVVNLDEETLEVYRGFQEKPHAKGRFAKLLPRPSSTYYPIALVKTFKLAKATEKAMLKLDH